MITKSRQRTLPYAIGWELLLPPMEGCCLLCIDPAPQPLTELAAVGRRVDVLLSDGANAVDLLAAAGLTGHDHVRVYGVPMAPVAVADRYDFVLIGGVARAAVPQDWLARQFDHWLAADALQADAVFCFVGPNRFAVRRAPDGVGGIQPRALGRLLRQAGFADQRQHALLRSDDGDLQEVISPAGYGAYRVAGNAREHLKHWLWSRHGAPWFSDATATVACRASGRPSMLDDISDRVSAELGCSPQWDQYLVLTSGKVIIGYPSAERGPAGVILVAMRNEVALARRSCEQALLKRVREHLSPVTRILLPESLMTLQCSGIHVFALQRMRGVSRDYVWPELPTVIEHAVDFALQMHADSVEAAPMTPERYQQVAGAVMAEAVRRNPALQAELVRLEPLVRARLMDGCPGVVVHGDYKVENILFDPDTGALTGVIDWEHAVVGGLPLIDIGYLLVYDRVMHGQNWLQAMDAVLVAQAWTATEAALFARYQAATLLPERLVPALRAMVAVHHIGARVHQDWTPESLEAMRRLLVAFIDLLDPSMAAQLDVPPAAFAVA